jgi:6-pyruvoyltetrahydropterin/6-carboxytetrahydropterin synthase
MPTTLTRTVSFFALHRLYRPEWSPERNRDAFGQLSEEPPHGHEYRCAVTVSGAPDGPPDLLIDLAELDRVLEEEVVRPFEGKYLNRDLPAFASTLPTCEAMAEHVFQRVAARLPAGARLERVRIMEDHTLYADCTGIA